MKKKMDGDPFLVDVLVNGTFLSGLVDNGCLCYSSISERVFQSLKLPRISIPARYLQSAAGQPQIFITSITWADIDIDGHKQRCYFYVVPGQHYDIIMGQPWMEDMDVQVTPRGGYLDIRTTSTRVRNRFKNHIGPKINVSQITQVMASTFVGEVKRCRKEKRVTDISAVSLADIEKALHPKPKSDPKEKLPAHYHQWLQAFNRQLADILPPHRPGVDLKIELERDKDGNEKQLPWGPLYGMGREELLVLRKTLTELLGKEFIRVSSSAAAAPVLMVKKPGGGIRFCVDYRGLNKITKKDRYPLPLLSETIRNISKAKWFTKLDVIAAFNKVRIAAEDVVKTAFRTRYGSFEWLVMPFGLTGAPAAFQRYINSVLQDYLDEFASAYIDDVLIYSSGSLQDHRKKVGQVLQRLMDAGLQIDIDKCEFEVKKIKYLGFVFEAEVGIRVDPEKVAAIQDWATPHNVREVRAFIGFANFYRIFIPEFSDLIAPLTELTKKVVEWNWTKECNKAFEAMKGRLIMAPILAHFDPDKETLVEADSSGYATGGLLLQKNTNGHWLPVAYYSKKHSSSEVNYPIHDKELLAIVRCLEAWRPELKMVKHFSVLTDHKNLRYFYTDRQLTERQVRWSEFLSQYNFTLEWRPGKQSGRPDALSRRAQDLPYNTAEDERLKSRFMTLFNNQHLRQVTINSSIVVTAENIDFSTEVKLFNSDETLQALWCRARQDDQIYQELTKAVLRGDRELPTELQKKRIVSMSELTVDDRGLLIYRDRYWIPDLEPLRTKIIQDTHDSHLSGHPGRDLTYTILSRQFYWPNASSDVRQFVRNCEICGRNTIWRDTKRGLLKPLPIGERVASEISLDFITDLPPSGEKDATNCLVITDRLTKGVLLEAMADISAEATAKRIFYTWYPYHGLPRAITSDRGPQFVSELWRHLCKLVGIEQRLSTAYHPQTDGSTERVNQEIEKMLRIWTTYMQNDWSQLLPIATMALNEREASATGMSPFFYTHGYHQNPIVLEDDLREQNPTNNQKAAEAFVARLQQANEYAQASIAMAQETQQYQANKHRTAAPRYKPGDWVYLHLKNVKTTRPSKKLDWLHAKYQVVREVNSHAYELDIPGKIHKVFHVDLLRAVPQDPLPSQLIDKDNGQPVLLDGQEAWLVERILDYNNKEKKAQVKWVDYKTPTWEPLANMRHTDAWKHWQKQHKKQQRGRGGG